MRHYIEIIIISATAVFLSLMVQALFSISEDVTNILNDVLTTAEFSLLGLFSLSIAAFIEEFFRYTILTAYLTKKSLYAKRITYGLLFGLIFGLLEMMLFTSSHGYDVSLLPLMGGAIILHTVLSTIVAALFPHTRKYTYATFVLIGLTAVHTIYNVVIIYFAS